MYDERREELEKHEFMMGVPRGRLAVALDVLTDALVLASGTIDLDTTVQLGTGTVLTSGGRSFVVRGASSGQTAISPVATTANCQLTPPN